MWAWGPTSITRYMAIQGHVPTVSQTGHGLAMMVSGHRIPKGAEDLQVQVCSDAACKDLC